MGVSREDVDLFLVLTNPESARYFILHFDWNLPIEMQPVEITLNSGRTVSFHEMSDEDAVAIALQLVRSITIPRAEIEHNLEQFDQ
jgi:hypothetical protein